MTAGLNELVMTIPKNGREEIRFAVHAGDPPTLSITSWRKNGTGGFTQRGAGVAFKVTHMTDFIMALQVAHGRAVAKGLIPPLDPQGGAHA